MALGERLLDALTTVIKMNDKVERLAELTKAQQARIEDLTGRVIRPETALEMALATRGHRGIERK